MSRAATETIHLVPKRHYAVSEKALAQRSEAPKQRDYAAMQKMAIKKRIQNRDNGMHEARKKAKEQKAKKPLVYATKTFALEGITDGHDYLENTYLPGNEIPTFGVPGELLRYIHC